MARTKKQVIYGPPDLAELEIRMSKGIRTESLPLFARGREKLMPSGLWDVAAMRGLRDACLLNDDAQVLTTAFSRKMQAGELREATALMKLRKEAIEERDQLLIRWGLVPAKRRGRPHEEVPSDLVETEADDGWDSFGDPGGDGDDTS